MMRRLPYLLIFLALLSISVDARATADSIATRTASMLPQADQPAADTRDDPPPRKRRVQAMRVERHITIDGKLDEDVWQRAPVISDLLQRDPDEGSPASERTVIHVLYDDEALYIGAHLYDASPDSIVARLGRRDADLEADRFGFFIDPYHDRRTGFYFGVNAAGTLYDGVLMNDDWDDDSWDGVWQGEASIGEDGWTAELRIPYSQLRFYQREDYVWGVNFRRDIARKNEQSYLVYTPRNESGFVSRFVDMVGVAQISPPRQLEVVPYVTARAAYTDHEAGDPFNDGSSYTPDAGADLKFGLTNNLTLNMTVNPDFGQVEVDPAVVNLSDVETFFPEKRPFFIEGATIFNFGRGGANNYWGFNFGDPNFFYSRRIGRAPQGSLPDYDYADYPDGTRILGAAKVTGKLGKDWNVGTVQAVTARETAAYEVDGETLNAEVEPPAYYGITRAQKEFADGRQALGFIATSTARSFRNDRLRDQINDQAYALGVDGWTFLDEDRTWVVTGWMGASHIRGTREQMLDVQQNPQHYFQRPDAGHVSLDSSATSLTGVAGRVMLNKQRGRFYTNAAVGMISPGFDVNDVGFQWRADVINAHLVLGYRWNEPRSFYRSISLYASHYQNYDFGGNRVETGFWGNSSIQFTNYYSIHAGGQLRPSTLDNSKTRGGPLMRDPANGVIFLGAETDSRKPLVFEAEGYHWRSEAGREVGIDLEAEWKPAANVSISVQPGVSVNKSNAQWVDAFDDPTATSTFGKRYVFAKLDQLTVSSSVRLNWTFTPRLSFQLYAQPLISAGEYGDYKELARPRSYDFLTYGPDGGTIATDDGEVTIDPDGAGPAEAFAFDEPDFNFTSLRGTAVLRWEFRPGSTLFLVWTQTRDESLDVGDFRLRHDVGRLLDGQADNIFMLKLTYWFSR